MVVLLLTVAGTTFRPLLALAGCGRRCATLILGGNGAFPFDTERVARSRPEHFGLEFPLYFRCFFSSLGNQQMCGLDGKAQLCVCKTGENFLKVTIQALFTLGNLVFSTSETATRQLP